MNMLKGLNRAMAYIESSLTGDVDLEEAARLACVSADGFARFFSYMTGMTVKEYIRCRRLTLAAMDLGETEARVIDIALKYGYDSVDAFSRAFARQHGLTPTAYRKGDGWLKTCFPASFQIKIIGADEMDMRMTELPELKIYGISRAFEGRGYRSREELRNKMWSELEEDVPGKISQAQWNQPGSQAMDGVWYGLWQKGRYLIAREKSWVKAPDMLEIQTIPAGTYAAFRTKPGGLAWEEIPRAFEEIFQAWFPASDYRQKGDLVIEVYHLWTDKEQRKKKRYYEVWVPVERKEQYS